MPETPTPDPTPGQVRLGVYAFEALMDDALRCPCDQDGMPVCVRCECLFRIAVAATDFAYGLTWRSHGRIPPPTWTPEEAPHA